MGQQSQFTNCQDAFPIPCYEYLTLKQCEQCLCYFYRIDGSHLYLSGYQIVENWNLYSIDLPGRFLT